MVLEPSTGHETMYLEGHQNAMIDGATPHLLHTLIFDAISPEIVIPLSKNDQIIGNENMFSQNRTRTDVSLDFLVPDSGKEGNRWRKPSKPPDC